MCSWARSLGAVIALAGALTACTSGASHLTGEVAGDWVSPAQGDWEARLEVRVESGGPAGSGPHALPSGKSWSIPCARLALRERATRRRVEGPEVGCRALASPARSDSALTAEARALVASSTLSWLGADALSVHAGADDALFQVLDSLDGTIAEPIALPHDGSSALELVARHRAAKAADEARAEAIWRKLPGIADVAVVGDSNDFAQPRGRSEVPRDVRAAFVVLAPGAPTTDPGQLANAFDTQPENRSVPIVLFSARAVRIRAALPRSDGGPIDKAALRRELRQEAGRSMRPP